MGPTSTTKKKASSSKATKRPVAAKRKKTTIKATPSSSSKSSKTKVNATTSSLSNRKRKKTPSAPPVEPVVLPSDWPATSQPPIFPKDASALRPGSLLQQTCSGQDIQLARSACVVPNFEKKRGKFLFVFPGNFSFGAIPSSDTSSKEKAESPSKASNTQSDNDEDDKPISTEEEGKSQTKMATAKNNSCTTMGRIEGLRTNTPSFRIPFPHLQKSLVFAGKKVSTTSKYLVLSCSNKKNGTVQCKNIFSSAVVFGMPKWESTSQDGKVISTSIDTAVGNGTTSNTTTITNENDEKTTQTSKTNDVVGRPFLHYGGSERTVDGATRSSRKSSSSTIQNDSTNNSDVKKLIPIWSNHGENTSSSMFDFSNSSTKIANPSTVAKPKTLKLCETSSEDEQEHSDSDSDSDDDYHANISSKTDPTLSAEKTRLPPRRQASMTKKRYVEEIEEETELSADETNGSDSDEKDSKELTKKQSGKKQGKASASKGKTASLSKKQQPKQKAVKGSKGRTGTDKKASLQKKVIDVDEGDDNDDNDSSSDVSEFYEVEKSSGSKRQSLARQRKSRSQKKTNYKELDESDGEESDNDDESDMNDAYSSSDDGHTNIPKKSKKDNSVKAVKKKSPSASAATPSRSKTTMTKTPSSKKRKTVPKKSNQSSTTSATESAFVKRQRKKNRKEVSVLETASTPSPSVKSPFRRRHKTKSPSKKPRTSVLDLTQDDEFAFG